MYIDFHKYNYDLIDEDVREKFVNRDKKAYQEVLRTWFENHIKDMVDRKWEVEEIFFLKETSEFIKLLKEAENLYELGFFTGCIALVGISAEDFTKYIALRTNHSNLLKSGVSQCTRLKTLKDCGIISSEAFRELNIIRDIRNGCLHFDDDFKRKMVDDLKNDALHTICAVKRVMSLLLGIKKCEDGKVSFEIIPDIVSEMVEELKSENRYIKGLDDVIFRLRNSLSQLFDMPIAFEPDKKQIVLEALYKVENINYDAPPGEIDLVDLTRENMIICVDLDKTSKQIVIEENIQQGDILYATVYSKIDKFGQSSIWYFLDLKKIDKSDFNT